MDIKDFILIGGGLLIAGVIAHGFYIAWRGRRDTLRMDIAHDLIPEAVDDLHRLRGELPNGGARVVSQASLGEQASLELDTVVVAEPLDAQPPEPAMLAEESAVGESVKAREPTIGADDAPRTPAGEKDQKRPGAPRVADVTVAPEPIVAERPRRTRRPPARKAQETAPEPALEQPPVEELVVMNVLAPRGQPFAGDELFASLRGRGLKFGNMNIFHRLDAGSKKVQFSVANIVEPGTFEMSDMETIRSPGLCFFLQLPGPENPLEAFETMLSVAHGVAEELNGELKDEQRSFMTPQTEEHYRQRILEFSRRRMSKRA
ncbi:MAG TPA: cell division protein ZipA [Pseudomonadales bacterium]